MGNPSKGKKVLICPKHGTFSGKFQQFSVLKSEFNSFVCLLCFFLSFHSNVSGHDGVWVSMWMCFAFNKGFSSRLILKNVLTSGILHRVRLEPRRGFGMKSYDAGKMNETSDMDTDSHSGSHILIYEFHILHKSQLHSLLTQTKESFLKSIQAKKKEPKSRAGEQESWIICGNQNFVYIKSLPFCHCQVVFVI